MTQWDLSEVCKAGSTSKNQLMLSIKLIDQRKKNHRADSEAH